MSLTSTPRLPHVSPPGPSAPAPVMPQQDQPLHSHGLAQLRPVPRELPDAQGCPGALLLAGMVGWALAAGTCPDRPPWGHLTIIAASPPVPQIFFLTVSFGSPCLPLINDVGLLSFSSNCLSPSPVHFFSVEVICLLLLHEHYLT